MHDSKNQPIAPVRGIGKVLLVLFALLAFCNVSFAQQQYTVNIPSDGVPQTITINSLPSQTLASTLVVQSQISGVDVVRYTVEVVNGVDGSGFEWLSIGSYTHGYRY
jgi:hypothetical protein